MATASAPRTIPGTDSPYAAYFTRGSGHNTMAQYTERGDEWQANLDRLARKHEFARTIVPAPISDEVDGAEIGIIAYGSTDPRRRRGAPSPEPVRRQDELSAAAGAAIHRRGSRPFLQKVSACARHRE